MIQRHSIILWRKADREDKSFEEIARETYNVLNVFQNYPQELRPNYLTAKTKKDTKEFEWNYENFCSTLSKGINKEGKRVFENLGYLISFFSSMNEEDSCGFEVWTGNKSEKFHNTLIINLPLSMNLYDEKTAKKIISLFETLVQTYAPYWGCISNKVLSRKYGKYLVGNLPTTIHWLNYWSEDIIQAIGVKNIQKTVDANPEISFENGIMLIRNTAIDVEKEDDLKFHDKLQKQLSLDLGGNK